jgi:copper chaperone
MSTFKYSIEGLSCGHCVKAVEGILEEQSLKGSVDLDSASLSLDAQPEADKLEALKSALAEEGYTLNNA